MKFKSATLIFTLLVCLTTLSSCSSILLSCYGMKNPKQVDNETILKQAKKYNIPESQCYVLDSSYNSYVKSLGTPICGGPTKEHTQPLQALYFDIHKDLVSFQNNCHAGGFPNLKWNRNGIMETFPPGQQTPLDTLIPFETQLEYFHSISGDEKIGIANCDYVVIVFWNKFMGRQSKRLIKNVQENSLLAKDKKVKILYVNSDNQFADN